jgi:hypothetical protein
MVRVSGIINMFNKVSMVERMYIFVEIIQSAVHANRGRAGFAGSAESEGQGG